MANGAGVALAGSFTRCSDHGANRRPRMAATPCLFDCVRECLLGIGSSGDGKTELSPPTNIVKPPSSSSTRIGLLKAWMMSLSSTPCFGALDADQEPIHFNQPIFDTANIVATPSVRHPLRAQDRGLHARCRQSRVQGRQTQPRRSSARRRQPITTQVESGHGRCSAGPSDERQSLSHGRLVVFHGWLSCGRRTRRRRNRPSRAAAALTSRAGPTSG